MTRLAVSLIVVAAAALAQPNQDNWKPLFDGRTLGEWKKTAFANSPAPRIENDSIVLPAGNPLTGITWTGAFPKSDYEIRFEAARQKGGDFFASLTFPVGDSFATWVLGGWGGDIVGISSIDGWDASDNETRSYAEFETGRWYRFRLRVTATRITCWIDDQSVVNVDISGREVSLRPGEIKLSTPLGFASYNTTGAIRKLEYRFLM